MMRSCAERLDAAAAELLAGIEASTRVLTPAALRAARVISQTPGLTGDEIAIAIVVPHSTFRNSIVPLLKQHGYYSRQWGGGGYFPPSDAGTRP
jgi:hypothetical protein